MTRYIYLAQSLDGYIAGPEGELDWLDEIPNPEGSDFGFAEFMAGVDALVMGRKTFETVQGFGVWPYEKPVYVVSSTLETLPEEYSGKAWLMDLQPAEIVAVLEAKGQTDLYIDGGMLIRAFLDENLIDEMIITTVPVLLGEGIPLFGGLARPKWFQPKWFRLEKSEVMAGMLVKNHYVREAAR